MGPAVNGGTGPEGPPTGREGPATGPETPSPRPLVERLGLAFIALVVAVLFGSMSVAAWAGGELFLAVMAGIGALMTIWAAAATVLRG